MAFVAYFDESGTNAESQVVVMGGCLTTTDAAHKFTERWLDALSTMPGQPESFHMTDYENRRLPFDTWTNEERVKHLCTLIDLINEDAGLTLACGVPLHWYREVVPSNLHLRNIGPYMMNLLSCRFRLGQLSIERGYEKPVPIICDQNKEMKGMIDAVSRDVDENARKLLPCGKPLS